MVDWKDDNEPIVDFLKMVWSKRPKRCGDTGP